MLRGVATTVIRPGGCVPATAVRWTISVIAAALSLAGAGGTSAQIHADSTAAAMQALEEARESVLDARGTRIHERVRRMIDLGLWSEAEALLGAARTRNADIEAAGAALALRQHHYDEARSRVMAALRLEPRHREARLLRARLAIQAWQLANASATVQTLLAEDARDADAAILLGRVRLLEKDFAAALRWAEMVKRWNPRHAGAWLLEAETRFWDQDPAGAEPALMRALELDPFDADARFAYGYAIWRRVDATQLDAMAAQWELALAVDPVHYATHWHWGNGHTNLTYADYAHPTDSIVRSELAEANRLLAADLVGDAIAHARTVERSFPGSVLPAMLRGSAFYLATDIPRAQRLDSAQAAFAGILARKSNYGPAHNGLAAVIKQRQFAVLADFDSLEAAIDAVPLPRDPRFVEVFDDVADYPGERVLRMVRSQLGPTEAYVPMLHRLGLTFTVPPLHVDLAEAMDRSSFRYTTTFDNRQWMDIRGVGGGAAGIEYVERGAHEERNVLLHEYAHLFHGNVLTDSENRRIRALYHAAMEAGRTLDYYAANNESEFFAQAFEAYVMPEKVHPLNHKSMNTTADLRMKDPVLFAFIDSMAIRQRAFLTGDSAALRSNWAQVYVALAQRAGRARSDDVLGRATALLDTALVHDANYVPAMLARAGLLAEHGSFEEADEWIARAEAVDSSYAPLHTARAAVVLARQRAGEIEESEAFDRRSALLRRALAVETDLAVRASLNGALRELLAAHGHVPDALAVAEEYAENGPAISTYLRDRRDEALAFALELRAAAGYGGEAADALAPMVARKPFHYQLRAQYADALLAAGRPAEALAAVEEGQRVLRAAGEPRLDYVLRAAEANLALGRPDSTRALLTPLLPRLEGGREAARAVRILARTGLVDAARGLLGTVPEGEVPADRAERALAVAALASAADDPLTAERALRRALDENPYHAAARLALVSMLVQSGDTAGAGVVVSEAASLRLPLGPAFRERAAAAVR